MAGDHFEEPEVWDEYQWERFLQQQDRKTEKYFGLLEQYMDHPDRDELIAQEMGWEYSPDEDFEEWESQAGEFCDGLVEGGEDGEEDEFEDDFEEFTQSPVYADTLQLHAWVNRWIDRSPGHRDRAEAVRMASSCAVCGAKLAAALCGSDETEIGMTIAYLKRALKSANDALDAAMRLCEGGGMGRRELTAFQKRLFPVRDRVVDLMNQYRQEWRRRHGSA